MQDINTQKYNTCSNKRSIERCIEKCIKSDFVTRLISQNILRLIKLWSVLLVMLASNQVLAATQGEWGNPSTATMQVSVTILKMDDPGLLELYQFGACTRKKDGKPDFKNSYINDEKQLDTAIECLEEAKEIVLVNQIKEKGLIRLAPI